MTTLHHDHSGHCFLYLKRVPERVLEMCTRQRSHGEDVFLDLNYWQNRVDAVADLGQRLLAVAFNPVENAKQQLTFKDIEGGLTLLGILGIIDPPSDEAIKAVRICKSAGIRVKMITGDYDKT